MLNNFRRTDTTSAVSVVPVTMHTYPDWCRTQPAPVAAWLDRIGYKPEEGKHALVPGSDGSLGQVVLGVGGPNALWPYAGLPFALPAGWYRLTGLDSGWAATRAALGWALGSYAFTRYRSAERAPADLVWPTGADQGDVERTAAAVYWARDLINTPASDLGPAELAAAARALGREFDAQVTVLVGDELLQAGYPTIHAVGKGSARPPLLIDLKWGRPNDPKVTLVGKGVCFDSGGLDLKPASGMLLMKKDMGGAASVLGTARMVMMAGLPVRLRVLVPAVENMVSGTAFRPLDVIKTRKGLTVEVGNTDAEGRLILCDALAEADSEGPDLLIDMATLTGAARVALGPEISALFSNDDDLAGTFTACAEAVDDPVWRLPLWQPYRQGFKGKVADLNNIAGNGFAGAVVAALFLESFVSKTTPWAHLDIRGWNDTAKPGRPEGGEGNGLRAAYRLIERKFGTDGL